MVSAQSISDTDTTIYIKDFNGDNKIDSIFLYQYEYYQRSMRVYSSISDSSYFIPGKGSYNLASKANFLSFIPLPDELLETSNQQILDSIKNYLIKNFLNPDPSLNWLLSAYQNQTIIKADSLFHFIITPDFEFNIDSIPTPRPSYKTASKDTLEKIWNETIDFKDLLVRNKGFLLYYGHNHLYYSIDNPHFKTDTSNSEYTVKSTKHGVIAEHNGKYSWIFVSNSSLTGGPWKLRWASIKKVHLIEHYVVIQHGSWMNSYNNVFVINLKNGKLVKLKTVSQKDFNSDLKMKFFVEVTSDRLILNYSKCKGEIDDCPEIEIKSKTLNFNQIKKRLE